MRLSVALLLPLLLGVTPLLAQDRDSTARADSIAFDRAVDEEVDRVLHQLGLDRDSTRTAAPEHHGDTTRTFREEHRLSLYADDALAPQAYDEWQAFNVLRYNKVDGLFLGVGSSVPRSLGVAHFGRGDSVHARAFPENLWRGTFGFGYAFGSHYWSVEGGLSHLWWLDTRPAGTHAAFELGVEGHLRTDTRDAWLIPTPENTLAAILAHEDFQDYFKRAGYSAQATLHLAHEHLTVAWRSDKETALEKREYWSLFGGRKLFRDNAPITEGTLNRIVITSWYDNVRERRLWHGTRLLIEAELGAGDFPDRRYTVDLRRYQPLIPWLAINVRGRAGAVTGGPMPLQDAFTAGGISTMPAFDAREFVGNRALVLNGELLVRGSLLDAIAWFPFHDLTVMLLGDAGTAVVVDSSLSPLQGWENVSTATLHSDVGFAFGTTTGAARLGWLWRTDRAEGARFFIRLSRAF